MEFPVIDDAIRLTRLKPPTGKVKMVLDTDTKNEIDDQFAVAYAMLSPQHVEVEAIYAAPFSKPSVGPAEGMEQSYEEILRVLELLGVSGDGFAFRGSDRYLPADGTPVVSPAVEDLVERAKAHTEEPLYVVAIGAITNVASALLMAPEIIHNIVVVWLGGQPHYWPTALEYNLRQDVPGARLVFDCGVPFVRIPAKNVSEHLRTTVPELREHIAGRNALCDFLFDRFCSYHHDHFAWAKEIWDISSIAWLINPEWVPSYVVHSPILTDQVTWSHDASRHFIREATDCRRNPIFADMFRKLQQGAPSA